LVLLVIDMLLEMICIGLTLARKCQRAGFFGRPNTMPERMVVAGKNKLASTILLSDQRGAVAFETVIVWAFLMLSLLLPLADLAIVGFQFISAWGALRAFGQYVQYNQPPDVTNASGWITSVSAKADPRFPISNLKVICGDTGQTCSSGNDALTSIKYYSYNTTVTWSPIVLGPLFHCPCSFTLPYSERFQ
jgi:hypothetical protein